MDGGKDGSFASRIHTKLFELPGREVSNQEFDDTLSVSDCQTECWKFPSRRLLTATLHRNPPQHSTLRLQQLSTELSEHIDNCTSSVYNELTNTQLDT